MHIIFICIEYRQSDKHQVIRGRPCGRQLYYSSPSPFATVSSFAFSAFLQSPRLNTVENIDLAKRSLSGLDYMISFIHSSCSGIWILTYFHEQTKSYVLVNVCPVWPSLYIAINNHDCSSWASLSVCHRCYINEVIIKTRTYIEYIHQIFCAKHHVMD